MMIPRPLHHLLLLCTLGLAACGGDASGRTTPAGVYWEGLDIVDGRECTCGFAEMGYETEAACRVGFVDGPDFIDCVEEVYPSYLDTSLGPSFRCHADPLFRYGRCIEPLSCGDRGDDCFIRWQNDIQDCPILPELDPVFEDFQGDVFSCLNDDG